MREIRDRNTEQHQDAHSVNTEKTFVFYVLIYFTPNGDGGGNRLH